MSETRSSQDDPIVPDGPVELDVLGTRKPQAIVPPVTTPGLSVLGRARVSDADVAFDDDDGGESGEADNGCSCDSESDTPTRGCPISMVTGEELLGQVDFVIGNVLPLVWRRFYRTGHNQDRGLGHGWTFPGCERLCFRDDQLVYEDGEGRTIPLPVPGDDGAAHNTMEGLTLEQLPTGGYRLHSQGQQVVREFYPHPNRDDYPLGALRTAQGQGWRFAYSGGQLHRLRSDCGWELELKRDAHDRISAVLVGDADHRRPWVHYTYSADGDLITVTDRAGASEHFAYRNHVITRRTEKTGFAYTFEWDRYDIHGRCLRQCGDDGIYNYRFEWEPEARRSRAIDSYGTVETFEYNAAGRITRVIDPLGYETRHRYDAHGRLVETIGPEGQRHRLVYDAQGRLNQRIDPTGAVHRLEHDAAGRPSALTDPLGQAWSIDYDTQGRVAMVVAPNGFTRSFAYDSAHRPVRIEDSEGHVHTLAWDARHRLSAETDAAGRHRVYHYDNDDRLVAVDAPDGQRTHYAYDAMGRVSAVERPDGARATLHYDTAGRLVRYRDPLGQETHYTYGGLSQITARTTPDGSRLAYRYDLERRLIALVNENGETYRFSYDARGRLVEEIGFDGRRQRYHYASGQAPIAHDDNGMRTDFQRDPLGRLLRKTASDGSTARFTYDAAGRLTSAITDARALHFEYDAAGNPVAESQDQHRLSHLCDSLGRRLATQSPLGTTFYSYTAEGHLESICHNGTTLAAFRYDAYGREVERTQGALHTASLYDPAGRLRAHHARQSADGAPILGREYHYDALDRLHSQHDHLRGRRQYHYDARDRLTKVEGALQEAFRHDPAGNLLRDGQGHTELGTGNRLKRHGERHFHYDARGNCVRETYKGQTTDYHYNGFNQLVAVSRNGESIARYAYDAFNRRVAKHTAQGETTYTWDGDCLLSEHSDTRNSHYIHEPGTFRPLCLIDGEHTYHYHLDHLGTPQELTDDHGNLVWHAHYSAYGRVISKPGTIDNPLRFQGQYFDEETGLHYNRHRYYDPGTGRYMAQDPIGLRGGLNTYSYARHNPIGWVDPVGLNEILGSCVSAECMIPDNSPAR